MDRATKPRPVRPWSAKLAAAFWPAMSAADAGALPRQHSAVRSLRLALTALVVVAVVGTMLAGYAQLSAMHLAALALLGALFLAWSLAGTHYVVEALLWQRGGAPSPLLVPHFTVKRILFFVVHLGLGALLCQVGDRGNATRLLWLVLLPPVALSVIMLPRSGVLVVSCLSILILLANVVRLHGWELAPTAFLLHLFGVLFTLVFTLLAAGSERSRTEVERLAGELEEANRKLREYAVQVEELAATRERNRIAREIHDSLGHYLTVVNVQLEAARALGAQQPQAAWDAVAKAQNLTRDGLAEIRRSVAALRASPLDNQTLTGALRLLAEDSRASGLAVDLRVLGAERLLPPPAALTLYRAGQEGLTNVRKHAQVGSAALELDFQQPARVCLRIQDQGAGAPEAAASGFGLLGLRERAELLGGAVRVTSAPRAGFTLEVEVPG